MNSSIYRFSLDMHSAQSQISIPVLLGDTSRTFRISLSEHGVPFTIDNGCIAKISIKRPTGTRLEDFCTIEGNTTIVYNFNQNENTAAVEGIHDCDVTLYDIEGQKITSPRFTMVVSERVIANDDIIITDADITIIDAIVTAEASRQVAETNRSQAEEYRVRAEESRVLAEEERINAGNTALQAVIDARGEADRATSEANRAVSEANRSFEEANRAEATVNSAVDSAVADAASKAAQASREEVTRLVGELGIVQETGNSKTSVMSQAAVSEMLSQQDVAMMGLSDLIGQNNSRILTNENRITRNEKRITNIEQGIMPDPFETDSSVAYKKTVPTNALPYAAVQKVGGMTRKCANLIPYPYKGAVSGANHIVNADGSITFSGTVASAFTLVLCEKTLPAGDYCLNDGATATGLTFIAWDIDKGSTIASVVGTKKAFTLTEDKNVRVYYHISKDFSGEVTVYPMLNEGSTSLPYEPYYDGLRDAKVTEIKSVGENLIPYPYKGAVSGANHIVNADGTITFSGTAASAYTLMLCEKNLPAGDYCLNDGATATGITFIAWDIDNGSIIASVIGTKRAFTLTKDTNVRVYYHVAKGFSGELTVFPMLNRGSTDASYRPYKEPISYHIPEAVQALDGYGIGVDSTHSNYISYEDDGSCKWNKHCIKVVFDGSNDENWNASEAANGNVRFQATGVIKPIQADNTTLGHCVCDQYSTVSTSDTWNNVDGITTRGSAIEIKDNNYTDTNSFKQRLSNNPITVVYAIAKPEITDISDLITADNFIAVEPNGMLTFENEYGYDVPSEIVYQLKEVTA